MGQDRQALGLHSLNIDDGAGIVTGSPGLTSGRFGYGVYVSDTARVALVDGFTCEAQP